MDYGDVITDPMMLFMSHLSGLMHEQRLWMHECRIDLREARTHASNAHGKLYDVVTSNLTHTEAQSKINQTGWDALHRGAEMQADQQQRDWGYWQQIQQLNNQIVMLEHQKQQQQSAGPTFMQQLFPLIAMGLMPRMGAMGPMMMGMIKKMMPGMLPEGEEGEEGEEEEEEETLETPEAQPMEPPAAEAPNVSELDRLTLRDIGTPAEVRRCPKLPFSEPRAQ